MTGRQVLVQAGLAAVALGFAYLVWQRGPELAADEVIAVEAAKNDVVSVRFVDDAKTTWVELGHASDENGPYVTVSLGPQDKPANPKAPAEPAAKTPARVVRGSDAAEKLLASFAPLRASRGLGVLDAAKRKELGLDEAKQHITLNLRSGQRVFTIAPAPPGGSLPYLRDEASGRVYVVSRSLLSDFQAAASMLVERKVHGFRVEEADRVQSTFGATRRDFAVVRSEDAVRLAPAATPDKPDAALKTWHDRVFGLWPSEVLGQGEMPAEGSPQVALRLEYSARGRRLGYMEIGKVAAVASSAEGAKDTYYARSERTLGWIKVGAEAQSLVTDAPAALR